VVFRMNGRVRWMSHEDSVWSRLRSEFREVFLTRLR